MALQGLAGGRGQGGGHRDTCQVGTSRMEATTIEMSTFLDIFYYPDVRQFWWQKFFFSFCFLMVLGRRAAVSCLFQRRQLGEVTSAHNLQGNFVDGQVFSRTGLESRLLIGKIPH